MECKNNDVKAHGCRTSSGCLQYTGFTVDDHMTYLFSRATTRTHWFHIDCRESIWSTNQHNSVHEQRDHIHSSQTGLFHYGKLLNGYY